MVVSVGLAQFIQDPPKDYKVKSKKCSVLGQDYTWQEMLKTKKFYMLWLMLGLSSSAGLMIIGHISSIAKIQANWEGGFILVKLLSLFNTIGRFLGGMVSDKIGRLNLMKIIFLLQAINMFLFSKYNSISLLVVGAAVAGICYGSSFSVFPATISDLYGLKNFGINYGLMFTGWGLGGIIGPMTGAAIYDYANNYNVAYLVAGILLIVSLMITLIFERSKEKSVTE